MSRRKEKSPISNPIPNQRNTDAKLTFWERALGIWLAVFCVGLVGLGGWLLMRGQHPAAGGVTVSVPAVPETIKVSGAETLSFAAHAKGFQIYECRAKKEDATRYEWVLKAPEADLLDAQGKKMGRHYGGPTWESFDGSKVVGELKGTEPSTDANAIPRLLLGAKTHEGNGVFSRVSSIQRLETVGGKAPAGEPDQASLGKELRVPYTAVYYFYVPKP